MTKSYILEELKYIYSRMGWDNGLLKLKIDHLIKELEKDLSPKKDKQ